MALTLLSQTAGGKTLEQLQNGLRIGNNKTATAIQYFEHRNVLEKNAGEANFSIANAIYVQEGLQLNKSFEEVAVSKFNTAVESLNFNDSEKSAETINHFVQKQTNGKIKELFTPSQLKPNTRSVLVNAIYFKGGWERPFYSRDTRKQNFYNRGTEAVQADFMNMESSFNVAYVDDLDATALEMKYAKSNISFVIVLPESRTGLAALEDELKYYDLTQIPEKFKLQKYKIFVPKFKVEYDIYLNNVLKNVSFVIQR